MHTRLVTGCPPGEYAGVFEGVEGVVQQLRARSRAEGVNTAATSAVGRLRAAAPGCHDVEANSNVDVPVDERVPLPGFSGGVTGSGDGRTGHAHRGCGHRRATTADGYVWRTVVRPAPEPPVRVAAAIP